MFVGHIEKKCTPMSKNHFYSCKKLWFAKHFGHIQKNMFAMSKKSAFFGHGTKIFFYMSNYAK